MCIYVHFGKLFTQTMAQQDVSILSILYSLLCFPSHPPRNKKQYIIWILWVRIFFAYIDHARSLICHIICTYVSIFFKHWLLQLAFDNCKTYYMYHLIHCMCYLVCWMFYSSSYRLRQMTTNCSIIVCYCTSCYNNCGLIDYIKVLRHINTKWVIQCQNRWVH